MALTPLEENPAFAAQTDLTATGASAGAVSIRAPERRNEPLPASPVAIPETITVHLGAPSANAQNVTVPFADYIKNVASSEIYPTWPEQAIRANIYAQVSYVLNRVFTEWYRAQGYDFRHHQLHPLRPVLCAGAGYFREHLGHCGRYVQRLPDPRRKAIEPLFAQYCNGTTTVPARAG